MRTKELEAEIAALREEVKALRTELSMARLSQPQMVYHYHGAAPFAQPPGYYPVPLGVPYGTRTGDPLPPLAIGTCGPQAVC